MKIIGHRTGLVFPDDVRTLDELCLREREAAATAVKQLRSEENMRNQDMAQLKTFAAGQKVPPAWLELE